ncbi:MAG: PilN domain-containing protein [Candidatus Omnitrophica bacterium]|nr:PilN domain-containing protein [Candidatus Omnitrophota bacterium]
MLEINLLPLQMRRRKELFPPSFLFRLGGLFLILLIVISLITAGIRWQKGISCRRIEEKWRGFFQLEDKNRRLEIEKGNLEKYLKRKILWAEKFDLINQLIPPGVWLTKLYWGKEKEEEKVFIIEGQSLALKGGAVESVIKFMDNLKNNPAFFVDFKKIDLITRKESEGTMGFKLVIK